MSSALFAVEHRSNQILVFHEEIKENGDKVHPDKSKHSVEQPAVPPRQTIGCIGAYLQRKRPVKPNTVIGKQPCQGLRKKNDEKGHHGNTADWVVPSIAWTFLPIERLAVPENYRWPLQEIAEARRCGTEKSPNNSKQKQYQQYEARPEMRLHVTLVGSEPRKSHKAHDRPVK